MKTQASSPRRRGVHQGSADRVHSAPAGPVRRHPGLRHGRPQPAWLKSRLAPRLLSECISRCGRRDLTVILISIRVVPRDAYRPAWYLWRGTAQILAWGRTTISGGGLRLRLHWALRQRRISRSRPLLSRASPALLTVSPPTYPTTVTAATPVQEGFSMPGMGDCSQFGGRNHGRTDTGTSEERWTASASVGEARPASS